MDKKQEELKEGKGLGLYDNDTLEYVQKPLGKAIYEQSTKKDISKHSDRIKCKVCDKEYVRSNATHHKNTNHHKIYEKMNTKIKNLLIN